MIGWLKCWMSLILTPRIDIEMQTKVVNKIHFQIPMWISKHNQYKFFPKEK